MDFVHLEDPSKGREENYLFWLRFVVSVILITYGVLMQFIHLIPRLGVTRSKVFLFAVVATLASLGFNYNMAGVIAFPVPFMLLVGTPIWFLSNALMFLYFYGRRLQDDRTLLKAFISTTAILVCQVGLTLVYPVYILGLVSIPSQYYAAYVVLLPVIKIAAKNIISAFVGDNHDMKPEVVIFNVEIFNALYVSLAMQNSTNVSTTLILFAVDFVQAWASMADVYREHRYLKRLMSKIPVGHPLRGQNFLEVARRLLEDDSGVTDAMIDEALVDAHTTGSDDENIVPDDGEICDDESSCAIRQPKNLVVKSSIKHPTKTLSTSKTGVRVVPVARVSKRYSIGVKLVATTKTATSHAAMTQGVTKKRLLGQVFSEHERTEFLRVATQLLFTIEFIILIEYTEVVVPFVYSLYMTAMYYLPNRAYYPQIADVDVVGLVRMVENVLVYAGLELLSFLSMGMLLKHAVGVSALHQLGFVLQTQWEMVQSKLLLWIFYSVQNTIAHMGADFSFQFKWMGSESE